MLFVAALGWFGLISQLSITLSTYNITERTLGGVLVQYISYFTVICNALVSISLLAILLSPASVAEDFLAVILF